MGYRRIVTGLDPEGRSCVTIDAPLAVGGTAPGMAWCTATLPADNSGTQDCAPAAFGFDLMHAGGSLFMVVEYPPGMGSDGTFWHATDTLDYLVVLKGEVVLMLETGEVRAGAGDCIVDRGVVHAWRNDTDETAALAIVILPAHPVGKGRTV